MNKRIFLSALSILTALGLAGGATFAYFSDTATSTGNTFSTGTLDLKLTDNNQVIQDTVDTTWSSSTMVPGGNPVTATLWLRNSGSVAGDNVHLRADNVVTDNNLDETGGAATMDKFMEITAASYDGGDILGLIPDSNGNGIKDLNDLQAPGAGPEIGKLQNLNTDHPLIMTIQLFNTADNTYQTDQVATTFTATLHQVASQ